MFTKKISRISKGSFKFITSLKSEVPNHGYAEIVCYVVDPYVPTLEQEVVLVYPYDTDRTFHRSFQTIDYDTAIKFRDSLKQDQVIYILRQEGKYRPYMYYWSNADTLYPQTSLYERIMKYVRWLISPVMKG